MANKNDDSFWNGVIGFIVIIIILGAASSESTPSQPTISPNTQTWQQYAQSPANEDVLVQLANSQKLIVALGNDVSSLQSQNVDIQKALNTVNNQLFLAQQQAREDGKRQSQEQWIATIVGTLAGWLLGFIAPTRPTLQKLWSFIKKPFSFKVNRDQEKNGVGDKSESGVQGQKDKDSNKPVISPYNEYQTNYSTSSKLCPKCKIPMMKQMATKGKDIGRWFYVCPNHQECQQIFPVE